MVFQSCCILIMQGSLEAERKKMETSSNAWMFLTPVLRDGSHIFSKCPAGLPRETVASVPPTSFCLDTMIEGSTQKECP